MSLGSITGEDCGYINALDVLLSVGESMEQDTPPALKIPEPRACTPVSGYASTTTSESESESDRCGRGRGCYGSKKRPREEENSSSCSSEPPKRARREEPRPRCSPTESSPDMEYCSVDRLWEKMHKREEGASYRIVPNYPDARWWLHRMPPGSRRKAVNVIYLIASKLNLEVGTPSMAVVLFDRFMSAVRVPVPAHKILFIAAVCLNMAGKIVDIDRGFCGGKAVMQMLRDMVPRAIKQKSEKAFAVSIGDMESFILQGMDSRMLELPPAIQCVAEITGWNDGDVPAWLHAVLLCDLLNTDTASTGFLQCDIARAVVEEVCGIASEPSSVCAALQRAKAIFAASRGEQAFRDPYLGVRVRHSLNACVSLIPDVRKT